MSVSSTVATLPASTPGCPTRRAHRATTTCPSPWRTDELLDEVQEFLTGVRPLPVLDRVLVTVLFTDIVGSTEHGGPARETGAGANRSTSTSEMVQRQLERLRGRPVEDHRGTAPWPPSTGPPGPLSAPGPSPRPFWTSASKIRAGLHCGEVEVRGGGRGGDGGPRGGMGSRPGPEPARCSFRRPSRTSWPARVSPSRTRARTSSRASQEPGDCSRSSPRPTDSHSRLG